ncbi:MAG: hypothetical protein CMP76_14715 [Flavobacterium sp.]|uniref:hypothetical protein n=1 Tax=Flavobacterium sp. TaxID=239 RepID=UPI000C3BE1B4|nr:hypothetical protein [Flavobacterium sp.]MBF04535.1 hypothetical protein [Flavobacterium sp.]
MTKIRYIRLIIFLVLLSSFTIHVNSNLENTQIETLELKALRKNVVGKSYVYDLTKLKNCNKTTIKYLGSIKTKNGKEYKILNSFYVFQSNSTCKGTSNIKIYDMKNKYVGKYYVGMPEELPDRITQNKNLVWENSKDCIMRKDFFINLENGLPEKFFVPCSKNGGNEYGFSVE